MLLSVVSVAYWGTRPLRCCLLVRPSLIIDKPGPVVAAWQFLLAWRRESLGLRVKSWGLRVKSWGLRMMRVAWIAWIASSLRPNPSCLEALALSRVSV